MKHITILVPEGEGNNLSSIVGRIQNSHQGERIQEAKQGRRAVQHTTRGQ